MPDSTKNLPETPKQVHWNLPEQSPRTSIRRRAAPSNLLRPTERNDALIRRHNSFENLRSRAVAPPTSRDSSLEKLLRFNVLLSMLSDGQKKDLPNWSEFLQCDYKTILGDGGFATVYRGRWLYFPESAPSDMKKVVVKAIKIAHKWTQKDFEKSMKLLRRELEVSKHLQHDNVLPFIGITYSDGDRCHPGLVSLFMENKTVMDYIGKNSERADTFSLKVKLIKGFTEGLFYLHNTKPPIIHGDLKPDNVLVDHSGTPKIADFGLSKICDENPLWITSRSSARGASRYQAPELFSPENPSLATLMSDVYAYALTCLQITTGDYPWSELSDRVLPFARLKSFLEPTRPKSFKGYTQDWFWEIWKSCWVENPSERPKMIINLARLRRHDFRDPRSHQRDMRDCVGVPSLNSDSPIPRWTFSETQLKLTGMEKNYNRTWHVKRAEIRGGNCSKEVALKLPLMSMSANERGATEVYHACIRWFKMTHESITPLLGVIYRDDCKVDFGSHFALICSWKKDLTAELTNLKDAQRRYIICDIANALCYLHSHTPKVVFGRLSPANVRLDTQGRGFIDGLGFRKDLFALQKDKVSKMTSLCLAPELRDHGEINTESEQFQSGSPDVYSWAMTGFFILTWGELDSEFGMDKQTQRPKQRQYQRLSKESSMWQLWEKCWKTNSASRLSMKGALEEFIPRLV